MRKILTWVHVNTADQHCSEEFATYEEARNAAEASAEPVAVVELTDSFDSALVWTPEGREHATILTWPPESAPELYDHSRAKEDARNA